MLIFLVFCFAPGVCAAPWGVLVDYINEEDPSKNGEKYLLRKILDKQNILVGIENMKVGYERGRTVLLGHYSFEEHEVLGLMLADAYNEWFFNAARHIRNNRREEEFADLLPILDEGVQLVIYDGLENEQDIQFHFVPVQSMWQSCGPHAAGCYLPATAINPPRIFLPNDDKLLKRRTHGKATQQRLTWHEIGHSLGLADQYIVARSANSDSHYHSAEGRESIMESADELKQLTCDDADAIINLIDITRGTRRGGDAGWRTLCPNSEEYYIGGAPAGVGHYRIALSQANDFVTLTSYDKKGQRSKVDNFKFFTPRGDVSWNEEEEVVTEVDKFGRPVLAEGQHGENIYYDYTYERVQRLKIKDGFVQSVTRTYRYHPTKFKNKVPAYTKERFFGQNAHVCLTKVTVSANRSYYGEYGELEGRSVSKYLKQVYNPVGMKVDVLYVDKEETKGKSSSKKDEKPTKKMIAGSKRPSGSLKVDLSKQVDESVANAKRQQLAEKLEQWSKKALRELSSKGKNKRNNR